ncbi:MAG TPA: DUF2231 domain-containing protein [Sphingomicrobium sp.]|nr:DUF2231 domain-containing protein [Sphingomicrobium sp.]
MISSNHKSVRFGSVRPWLIHPFFVSLGGSLLIAAFGTDVMYAQTALMQWSNASNWLITVGLVLALLAAIALLVDVLAARGTAISPVDFLLLAVAAVVSIVNAFVHSRDAWTSVVPEGIWLSGIAALLLLVVGVRGWSVTVALEPLARDEGDRP